MPAANLLCDFGYVSVSLNPSASVKGVCVATGELVQRAGELALNACSPFHTTGVVLLVCCMTAPLLHLHELALNQFQPGQILLVEVLGPAREASSKQIGLCW